MKFDVYFETKTNRIVSVFWKNHAWNALSRGKFRDSLSHGIPT